MKLLITDILFPNKYSTWRNEEINYFLKNEDTSILVLTMGYIEAYNFDFDFEFCNREGLLDGYNILIFNPKYNHANVYNKKIDGTKFNGLFNAASYLITKDTDINLNTFDAIYHIFSDCYIGLNNVFAFPIKKQFLHLYPGGGHNLYDPILYNKDLHLVCTHPVTSEFAKNNNYSHIDCWTVPLLNESYVYPNRLDFLTKQKLTVCFASIGNPLYKGADDYIQISNMYKTKYPNDKIEFISIGHCGENSNTKNYGAMDYIELQKFYSEEVDIYLNLENGMAPNGWPLGLESFTMGCVLLTKDARYSYPKYNIDKESIQVCNTNEDFVEKIKQLYINRFYLYMLSQNNNEFINRYISMNNQQYKIHSFIKDVIARTI